MINKYLFYFILFYFSISQSWGQCGSKTTPIEKKLSGKWQWVNLNDTFSIQIFNIDTLYISKATNDTFGPMIYGWHRYVENGTVVESSFPESSAQKPFSKGFFGTIMNKKSILLWFHDITRERDFRVEVEFIDSASTIMNWITHKPQERVFYPPPKPKIWDGQTIPSPIILHKISDN